MSSQKNLTCRYGPTNTYILTTPIGDMEVTSCPNGLHYLAQKAAVIEDTFIPDVNVHVKFKTQLYLDNGYTYKPALHCQEWLKDYFEKSNRGLQMPPMCPSLVQTGTFTHKVLSTLPSKVTFGQRISYGQVAKLCGSNKASRAVGQIMRNNPLQILIPCHRVICSSGNIGNYAGGRKNTIKEWLLQHEIN